MDWGLASDWGIPPAPERKPIGYWGHQCDGDEPGLNYCCGADRRWIGTKHLTNSGFQRNHFNIKITILMPKFKWIKSNGSGLMSCKIVCIV